jgi:hypothetical protein
MFRSISSLASVRRPDDQVEGPLGPWPVLAQERDPPGAQGVAKGKRGDEDVVELTRDRDEIRDQVDRHQEVSDERSQDDLAAPGHPRVAEEPAEEDQAVGDEPGERAGVGVAARGDQDEDRSRV